MGLAVHLLCRISVEGLNEAEDLAGTRVIPVFPVVDIVRSLSFQILLMSPATASGVNPST